MVSLRTLALLYKSHLRARPLRELLAMLGIAAGVALLFAVQVANKSVTGSFEQLTEGIAGRASLEVAARGPQGFDQSLFQKVKRLPDIEAAAPVMERRIAVRGPKGRRPLTLVGVDERLPSLGGTLARRFDRRFEDTQPGLYLTQPTAEAIGVTRGKDVTVEVGERTEKVPLADLLLTEEIGSLAESPVAVAPLGYAQEIAGMEGRISRVLVVPLAGREVEAKAALQRVVAERLNVRPADTEAKLLNRAAAADRQLSALFSVISLVVGILLAYNAMLLTMVERRRVIAGLQSLGASDKTIIASLAFDALVLGLTGSLLGILFGDLLSRYVMHQVPGYLSAAFAIGSQRVVAADTILLAAAGGILAAVAASARPAIELVKAGPSDAFLDHTPSAATAGAPAAYRRLGLAGVALVALFITFSLALPATHLIGVGVFTLGLVMLLAPLITHMISVARGLARRSSDAALRVAMGELAARPIRATALAAVGALAVFVIVGITGTAQDLKRGIRQGTENYFANADIWIAPNLEENPFVSVPFNGAQIADRVRQLPQVRSVRAYRASFFDMGERRLRVVGQAPTAAHPVPSSQIIEGDLDTTTRRIRRGGWAVLTKTVAEERGLAIGRPFTVPTPSGNRRFLLAATGTNGGWDSGMLLVNARDYARAWHTRQVSALGVDLADGVTDAGGREAIQRALGPKTAIKIHTATEGREANAKTVRQGLSRLDQIAQMTLIAAVLAVVGAMLAAVWQRRRRLSGLASIGMGSGQLYRTVLIETGVILLLGCLVGVAFGFTLQALGSRWLHLTTAYPVPFEPAFGIAFRTLALVTVLSAVAATLPVRFILSAKRAPSLAEE